MPMNIDVRVRFFCNDYCCQISMAPPFRVSSGRWTALALQQLLIVILLQLEAVPCNGYGDFCITHVNVENEKIEIEGNSTLQELSAKFVGDRLSKFSLFSVIHYVYLQPSESEQKYSLIIHVCDDTDLGDKDCRPYNSSDVATTNIASTSTNYAALGPVTWDLLTLGFMDLTERANVSTIFLPLPPCPGRAEIVTTSILKLVLKTSDIDDHKWIIKPFKDDVTVNSSQVILFMSVGLLSLFLTFLLVPYFAILGYNAFCHTLSRDDCFIAYHSSLITAALIAQTFLFYWIGVLIFYYRYNTADDYLFPNKFFSPLFMCLIFYTLSAVTSFIGGVIFFKYKNLKVRMNVCERLGSGFVCGTVTAGIFHSFFLLLALLEDPLATLSYIVLLSTTFLLMFVSLFGIILQYRKSGFQGHFCLVVSLQMIIFSLYIISINSFRKLTCEEPYVATLSYLFVVTVVSLSCVALSVLMVKMVAGRGSGRGRNTRNGTRGRRATSVDAENPSNDDGGGGGGAKMEVQLVRDRHQVADLTALAQEVGFVILIPSVVEAWQRRRRSAVNGGRIL